MNEIQITIKGAKGEKWIVKHPVELIKAFVCLEESYVEYDIKVPEKYKDAWDCAKKGMRARSPTPGKDLKEFWKKLENKIPRDTLEKRGWKETWNDFKKCKDDHKVRIGITGFTKLIHRFNPENIPLIDTTVAYLYTDKKQTDDDEKIKVLELIMNDFEKNKKALKKLGECLKNKGINLTPLRIFDILLWVKAKIFLDSKDSKKLKQDWFFEKG